MWFCVSFILKMRLDRAEFSFNTVIPFCNIPSHVTLQCGIFQVGKLLWSQDSGVSGYTSDLGIERVAHIVAMSPASAWVCFASSWTNKLNKMIKGRKGPALVESVFV